MPPASFWTAHPTKQPTSLAALNLNLNLEHRNTLDRLQHRFFLAFAVAQATGITSFDELLDGHGHGDGCEVCKPLVSSILASVNNDMIFNNGGLTLQDTNDRALANMQRGECVGSER